MIYIKNKKKKIKVKIPKVKLNEQVSDIGNKKKMRNAMFVTFLVLGALIVRIGYIQLYQGSELQAKAYSQQTLDRSINPRRGTIYDATGKVILAVSSTVETITVNPTNISADNKEKVAKALSEIFELDYETVLKKVSKRSSIETIIKKVDADKADRLRVWMAENNIETGINIDEDTKRYYPYSTLASQVIGFCGSDNQGLDGIEAKYEEELNGEKGKIERVANATGEELGSEGETYIDAVDGNDLVLTIDMTIQAIAEKYLEEACIDNVCTDGGNIVIMNPKNGDVLAMATYPNYDLNSPYSAYTEDLEQIWDTLSSTERTKYLQEVWRNKAISDTYEPGSVFKVITSSAAIEEGITDTDNAGEFACTGRINIAGTTIKCWRYYRPHGSQSLRNALMNSCNPVFIGLGQKLGVSRYYDYLEKFGYLRKTGIDLQGEALGIFLKEEKVGPVELATISFGQRFEVTPIQMATAVSVIANGGTYIQPRVVKQIINSQTGEVTELDVKTGERVISEETANKVLSMMESVVAEGTGKNAQVKGYRIGGKTGTSEDGVNTGKYVTSFVCVAPIEDPEVVVLVTLYNPTGEGGHQGGGVAAPVGGQILSEVLPYLEASKVEDEEPEKVAVPDIQGKSIDEAGKILKEAGLEIVINNNVEGLNKSETIVNKQTPPAGVTVNSGTNVYVDY